jgi:hypothetical protein
MVRNQVFDSWKGARSDQRRSAADEEANSLPVAVLECLRRSVRSQPGLGGDLGQAGSEFLVVAGGPSDAPVTSGSWLRATCLWSGVGARFPVRESCIREPVPIVF